MREWSSIILAGGKGKRLMPLTSLVPKPLVKVTNVPMVDYAIAHLVYADIKHIILALAHRGKELRDYIKKTWTPDKLGDIINARADEWQEKRADKSSTIR